MSKFDRPTMFPRPESPPVPVVDAPHADAMTEAEMWSELVHRGDMVLRLKGTLDLTCAEMGELRKEITALTAARDAALAKLAVLLAESRASRDPWLNGEHR